MVKSLRGKAREYLRVHTFVGAEEVEELTSLRDERLILIKLLAEQKREIARLRKRLEAKACGPQNPNFQVHFTARR